MSRRRIGSLLFVVALLVGGLLWPGIAGAHDPKAASTYHHLFIVFLPGLCGPIADPNCHGGANAVTRGRATFRTLISALHKSHVNYTGVFYSYSRTNPVVYSVSDTHQSLSRSIMALQRQIVAIRHKHAGAQFDLVGHSVGGVIAAGWVVADARKPGHARLRGVVDYVHSIVTLDSPLRGIQGQHLGFVLSRIFGGGVWIDLQSGSPKIRAIDALPNAWWRAHGHLHSVANRADVIVPPGEALLGTEKRVTDDHCSADVLFLSSCHGAVLVDASLSRFIACHWITNGNQCVTLTPTATATVTPSPTASPTVTPTVTPSVTPSATATPVPVSGIPPPLAQ